jgi:arsenate reductase (thioredoxin)
MQSKRKVLFVCTGNTCRSQIAESVARELRPDWMVYSAGVRPGDEINYRAVAVLQESGFSSKGQVPKAAELFADEYLDMVIVLGQTALDNLPEFANTDNILFHPITDPFNAEGTIEEQLNVYRSVLGQIEEMILMVE